MASVDLTDPQTLNLYTYARNNPIDLIDPSGLYSGYNGSNFRSLYAFFGSDIANLPGFGTEWGSMSDFYLAQYEERVDNAFSGRGFLTNEEYIEKEKEMLQDAGVIATVDVYWTNGSYEVSQWDFRDVNLANLIRARAGDLASQQSEPKGDWRVRELVRGGAPTAKAAKPALNVIATVMSFFTSPFVAAAGSGVAVSIGQGTARGSVKLLPQFTKSTIDDAVSITMKQKGSHIFAGKLHPKPYLNELAVQMGGRENVIRTALQNANGRFPASGIFELYVNVGGKNLTIRGFINKGKPIINTMY